MNYKELRIKYPEFVYKSFDYKLENNNLVINFLFNVNPGIEFKPVLIFKNISSDRFNRLDKNVIANFVFHLGLAEIPSYWKATCTPKIIIEAGFLNENQIGWWHDLVIKGMGQFFYENKIDFATDNFVSIVSTSDKKYSFGKNINSQGILIPIGGGKDSAVTLELLKDSGPTAFLVNPTKAALDVVEISAVAKRIIIERKIDAKLLELNEAGFLNGHTPFSAVIAFLSVFTAYLYGYSEVVLSNERSSDEENTIYLETKINHQYSKTLEFENKFRKYIGKYLTDVNYFSFLRPIYEIQIAKIFSKMPKYFEAFRSCNIGQKTNSWCSNCSKCLSTFILLKPFLKPEDLNKIFGEDLLNKESLRNTLSELIDENKVKPFECVGTRKELRDALDSKLEILESWNSENNLPANYQEVLKKYV